MKVLVDTHALLWFIEDDPRLSSTARQVLRSDQSELVFSVACAWEIVVKVGKGKLDVGGAAEKFLRRHIRRMSMRVLPVRLRHVLRVARLPNHHTDPFDRLLIAQSQSESIPLLTSDRLIRQYPVQTVW